MYSVAVLLFFLAVNVMFVPWQPCVAVAQLWMTSYRLTLGHLQPQKSLLDHEPIHHNQQKSNFNLSSTICSRNSVLKLAKQIFFQSLRTTHTLKYI